MKFMKSKRAKAAPLILALILIATSFAYFSDHVLVTQWGNFSGIKIADAQVNVQSMDNLEPGDAGKVSFVLASDVDKGHAAMRVQYRVWAETFDSNGEVILSQRETVVTPLDSNGNIPADIFTNENNLNFIDDRSTVINGQREKVAEGVDSKTIDLAIGLRPEARNKLQGLEMKIYVEIYAAQYSNNPDQVGLHDVWTEVYSVYFD